MNLSYRFLDQESEVRVDKAHSDQRQRSSGETGAELESFFAEEQKKEKTRRRTVEAESREAAKNYRRTLAASHIR